MQNANPESEKSREIEFIDPLPDASKTQSAMLALADVEGVLQVSIPNPDQNVILVRYDLNQIDLAIIEFLLTELGFHLDYSLLAKIKRALYYFIEDNEIHNLAIHHHQDQSTRDIFMHCYGEKHHGCRDNRPKHWRKYR